MNKSLALNHQSKAYRFQEPGVGVQTGAGTALISTTRDLSAKVNACTLPSVQNGYLCWYVVMQVLGFETGC